MDSFEYVAPTSLDECIRCLAEHAPGARVLAGGTDLLVALMSGKVRPRVLVSLKKIPELRSVDCTADGVTIGAACTLWAIENSPLFTGVYDFFRQAVAGMASMQIRNRDTLGGNICNASPAADTPGPLIVLGANALVRGPRGERTVPLEDLFLGGGQTVLAPDEMLVAVKIPPHAGHVAGCYLKLGRTRSMDLAVVGVAVLLALGADGTISAARVALSSVADRPIRAHLAEAALLGAVPGTDVIEVASSLAAECARPISDVRASAKYRREMVRVFTRRAISQAVNRLGDGDGYRAGL